MSAWKDCVTAALLGTGRDPAMPGLPTALEPAVAPAKKLGREAEFLTRAGALAWWRRAGWKPSVDNIAPVVSATGETLPCVRLACMAHLRVMLGGHCAEALPEWLGEAARRRRRIPPELLPALLDWTRQRRERMELAMAAGGARVRWLAAQNPEWDFTAADNHPERWETGSREQRAAILCRWRGADPEQARAKLEAVWSDEPAAVRLAFLCMLKNGLSLDDELFLERALDDRGKEVRAMAANLLACLPGSEFVARMTARAVPLFACKKGGVLGRAAFDITLPGVADAAAQRDGLDPKPAGAYRAFGEKAALLAQIVAAVPLTHWQQTFGQEPAALLKTLEKNDFARAVTCGWVQAAIRQSDAAWAQALLQTPAAMQDVPAELLRPGALSCLLPEAARVTLLKEMIRRHGLGDRDAWHEMEAMIVSFPDHLPVPLAQDLLRELRMVAGVEFPLHLRYSQTRLATKIPPKLLPFALDDWPEINPAADFVALLAFRRDALAALAQS